MVHVRQFLPTASVIDERNLGENRKSYTISYGGFNVDIGAFAISINSDQLLQWCQEQTLIDEGAELKRKLLEGKPDGTRLLVCVERFDYTKGIEERLRAYQEYLRQSAKSGENRRDIYYQIAASCRTGVSSYLEYQDRVLKLADEINTEFGHVVHIDTENHPYKEVVRYYKAADVVSSSCNIFWVARTAEGFLAIFD